VSSLKDFLSFIISAERENTSRENPAIGDFGPVGTVRQVKSRTSDGDAAGRAIQHRISNDFFFKLIGEDRKKIG
jgi:hypothetical protein